MREKVFPDCAEAIDGIGDGASVMVGGFLGRGVPSNLLLALRDKGVSNLTLIRNDCAGSRTNPDDVNILIANDQVSRVITCFAVFGSPKIVSELEKAVLDGRTELELSPQGTLAERIRAGGGGIGAFYTPVGVGTEAADGKEVRRIGGRDMILEEALTADFALVKAHRADMMGNLVYRMTSRNFNPLMAMAAKTTIAETENLEGVGDVDPDHVMTPSIFVDRVVHVPRKGG